MPSARRGRPPFRVDAAVLEQARSLAAQGMLERDIAHCLGCSSGYFPQLKQKHPDLAEAIRQGASLGLATVTRKLMEAIEDRNVTAIIWYLKVKGGWRENANTLPAEGEGFEEEETVSQRIADRLRRLQSDA